MVWIAFMKIWAHYYACPDRWDQVQHDGHQEYPGGIFGNFFENWYHPEVISSSFMYWDGIWRGPKCRFLPQLGRGEATGEQLEDFVISIKNVRLFVNRIYPPPTIRGKWRCSLGSQSLTMQYPGWWLASWVGGVDPIYKAYNCFPFSWIQLATETCNPESRQPSHHETSGRFPKPKKEERRDRHTLLHTWCQWCHGLRCWKTWSKFDTCNKNYPKFENLGNTHCKSWTIWIKIDSPNHAKFRDDILLSTLLQPIC